MPSLNTIFRAMPDPRRGNARRHDLLDILTIALVERTAATKSATQTADRAGNIGLTPPVTGPLALFTAPEAALGGGSQFQGRNVRVSVAEPRK